MLKPGHLIVPSASYIGFAWDVTLGYCYYTTSTIQLVFYLDYLTHVIKDKSILRDKMNCKWMGFKMLERLRFLASLPLGGTAQRERGGIRVANNRIIPHSFIVRFGDCFLRVPLMYQPCCLVSCCHGKLGKLVKKTFTKQTLQFILSLSKSK